MLGSVQFGSRLDWNIPIVTALCMPVCIARREANQEIFLPFAAAFAATNPKIFGSKGRAIVLVSSTVIHRDL